MPRDPFDIDRDGHGLNPLCRRAAVWLWFVGGITVAISVSLLLQAPALGALTPEQISRMAGGMATDPPLTGTDVARAVMLVVGLFGLLPGAGYILAAFFVRRGRRPAMWIVLVGLYLQIAIVAFYILGGTIAAFQQRNPVLLSLVVLVLGSMGAALLYTARTLHRALRTARGAETVDTDPWR